MKHIKELNNENRNQKKMNSVFSFLMILSFYSTITVPITGNIDIIFKSVFQRLKIVRINQLTQFFYSYNIIGFVTLLLFIFLPFAILKRKYIFIKYRNSLCGSALFISVFSHTVIQTVNYLFYEGVSSSVLFLPIVLFFIFVYIQSLNENELRDYSNCIENIIMIAGFINALVIIAQFFSVSSSWNIISNLRIIRPPGLFPDAILVSIFLVITLWLMLNKLYLKQTNKLLYVTVILFAGFLNGSRSFVILLTLVVLLLVYNKMMSMKNLAYIILLLLFAIFILILLIISTNYGTFQYIDGYLADSSRGLKRKLAFDLFLEKPIFGNGPSRYSEYELAYGLHGTNPHNYYLELLCESGLVGFLPFIMALVSAISISIRQQNKKYFGILIILIFASTSIGIGNSLPLMIIWFYTYAMIYRSPSLMN